MDCTDCSYYVPNYYCRLYGQRMDDLVICADFVEGNCEGCDKCSCGGDE